MRAQFCKVAPTVSPEHQHILDNFLTDQSERQKAFRKYYHLKEFKAVVESKPTYAGVWIKLEDGYPFYAPDFEGAIGTV